MSTTSSRVWTTDPDIPVALRIGETGISAELPITVGEVFKQTVKKFADNPAMAFKEGESLKKISYKEYYNLSVKAAKSFIKLGLELAHGVCIIGFNSVEWFVANFGAIFAGGLSCGLYTTNSPEICQYIATDCKANVVVVENDMQLQKFLKIRGNLPHLKAIVQYKGTLTENYPNVYEWEKFLCLGDDMDDQLVEDKIASQKPQDCASLIYTSGTTGEPKGVMLSHDNLTWTPKSLVETSHVLEPGKEVIVSYLPLSHIAAQIADIYTILILGGMTYFAQPDALKGTLGKSLLEVQSTLFVGVPRVWEKFYDSLKQKIPAGSSAQPPSQEKKKAIEQMVRGGLGFTQMKFPVTAAAPIHKQIHLFFAALGIPLSEVWGMSETTGPGAMSTPIIPANYKIGSVGKSFNGTEIRLDHADPTTGEGEICLRGRNVMMGYLNKPEKTREAIDDEGWLHSGDLGMIDKDGCLFVTGRMKELIITSGGENIAPVPIEDRIKKNVPFLSNVTCIGDQRKFVSCLVTLQCVMDPNTGVPSDDLDPAAVKLISDLGSTATKVSQVIETHDKAVYAAIQQGIDRANEEAISNASKVQKFTLLKADYSLPGGELGPTLKLKRFFVMRKYSAEIDSMYKD